MSNWYDPHCVYSLIEDGAIVYIGCSGNPAQRFKAHQYSRKLHPDVTMRVVRWYKSLAPASRWEGYYIEKLQPA